MKWTELIKKYRDEQQRFWRRLRQQRMIHGQQRQLDDLYREVHEQARPVFVLSTGRAGTKLLTRLLQSSRQLMPVHEPAPELAYHSGLAFREPTGSEALKMAIDLARYEYIRDAYLVNKRYVETNNRISFFAYYLAEIFPNASFIHLIRNPHNFIKSGLSRGWYTGRNLYDEGRISDQELFKNYSREEKIGWLWASTNNFVKVFGEKYKSRFETIRSEDLFQSPLSLEPILMKFQITDISNVQLKQMQGKVENSGKFSQEIRLNSNFQTIPYFHQLMDEYKYE
jgi:hypothetical protein